MSAGLEGEEERLARILSGGAIARYLLAGDPVLSEAAQDALSLDEKAGVRQRVAEKEHLTEEVELRLSQDMNVGVRRNLASNTHVRVMTQARLSQVTDPVVRERLAMNPGLVISDKLDVGFLMMFARGRELVAENLDGLDPATKGTLMPSWKGSLASLEAACRSLGPEAPDPTQD